MRLSVLLLSLLLWQQGTWAWMMPRTLLTTTPTSSSSHQARLSTTALSSPLSILSTRNDKGARSPLFPTQSNVPTRTTRTTATNSRTKLAAATPAASVASLGFWGNTSLAMLSIALVKVVYALARAVSKQKQNDDGDDDKVDNPPEPAGILNRCPWPFIFFHDVKQGFQDSPTWMVVAFVVLRMLWKRARLPVRLAP